MNQADFVELLRKMAHDMRVPLNTIISTGDMLVQGTYDPLTARQEKAMTRLQRNNYRLLAILDDFMTYIKADTGELAANPKAIDPRASLALWCEPIRRVIEENGLTFHLTTTENMPAVLIADELILKKIIQALLWNAVAHTTHGTIQVKSDWVPNHHWCVSIQDSGCGIRDDELPHIFEPFWRGEKRPQLPTAGAGLGLPMSLALAKLIGGNLLLRETTPQGSHFCVEIPIAL